MNDSSSSPSRLPPQFFLIWAVMFMSQALIVFASQSALSGASLTAPDAPAASVAAAHLPQYIFMIAALGFAVAAYVVPMLLQQAAMKTVDVRNGELSIDKIGAKVLPVWVIRWALIEGITMMGFAASMLYAEPTAIYPYAGAGLLGFVLTIPSERKIRSPNLF